MPCNVTVSATYRGRVLQHVEFCCAGECPDNKRCCVQISFDEHGASRTWCGCGPKEPEECHLVLVKPGPGSGGGQPEFICAGSCPHDMKCELRQRPVPPNIIQYFCECV